MKPGTMLAQYRVEEKIGVGGMGEVYRAQDTTLDRAVALKVLPERFAQDADRMARFEREARVLASLHHQNIASIFGFEKADGVVFLAMEMVEGEDLSELIRRGPVPVDEAVDIARQIAEGLEEAHEKGIIHRDLKPANVKIMPDGRVKLLDFGLARALAGETTEEAVLGSEATLTAAMTQAGTILGTAAYMSPEQARGREVDRRTDIWAFGVILFEMLTGQPVFTGETPTDTLAGILKSEPEWEQLPAGMPFQLERVLRRCLAKDPRQRLRDIGEARVRLEDPDSESQIHSSMLAASTVSGGAETRSPALRLVPWLVAMLALVALTWSLLDRGPAPENGTVLQLGFSAPEGKEFFFLSSFPATPVISPDGKLVIFGAQDRETGEVDLYLRSIDQRQAVRLDGTRDGQYPFWSPDSEWIAFFDRNEGLKKIRVGGGPAMLVCKAGNAKGGSWSVEDQIIFTSEYNTSLQIVPAIGGEPRPLTRLKDKGSFDSHRHPFFLPDGHRFLYLARGVGGQDSEIRLGSVDGKTEKVIMKSPVNAAFAQGYLLYVSRQTLMAQHFDLQTASLTGQPFPVVDGVLTVIGAAAAGFSASNEGSLVYLNHTMDGTLNLRWLNRSGSAQETISDQAIYEGVALSPDDRKAALSITDIQSGTSDIWILDLERNLRTRMNNNPADDTSPVWHPDGQTIYFASDRSGPYGIYRKNPGSTRAAELVLALDIAIYPKAISPDGKTLLYIFDAGPSGFDIGAIDLEEDAEPQVVVSSPVTETSPVFSPDGKWLSYASDISNTPEIYIAPWPELTPVTQVSTISGTWHFWTDDGRRLLYQELNGRMMEVQVNRDGGELRLSSPEVLFEHSSVRLEGAWLDVTGDGQRFLAIESDHVKVPTFCNLIIGWPRLGNSP